MISVFVTDMSNYQELHRGYHTTNVKLILNNEVKEIHPTQIRRKGFLHKLMKHLITKFTTKTS